MKPLHLIALLAALMGSGCATAQPVSVPEVAHATSPAPGIISAGRLGPADIAPLRKAGIRHVIDLTPDAETPGRTEEHKSELTYLTRKSSSVFCCKQKTK